jgi:transposase
VAEVQAMIATHEATIKHRPPYSPDLNSIEPVLARLKAFLCQTAERIYETL